MKTWLVIDCPNLCYRLWGVLRNKGPGWYQSEGLFVCFMRTVDSLRDKFETDHVAFCFDHPVLFRRQLFAKYKAHASRTGDLKALQEKERVRKVINNLWRRLDRAGFTNVFRSPGMESDDLMAKIAFTYSSQPDHFIVLVSTDKDLYQCLSAQVILYGMNGSSMTEKSFKNKYQVPPRAWARVKSIAGCKSDGVPGIPGIGEATALQWIRNTMPVGVKYQRIRSEEGLRIIHRNRQLVELPAEGCPKITLDNKDWSEEKWVVLAKEIKRK